MVERLLRRVVQKVVRVCQPNAFRRTQRLLNAADFKAVFDKPCTSSDRYFTVLGKPNNVDTARLGLAIARKRIKLATARNRIKRITRESFRQHPTLLHGIDCVVMAKAGADDADNQTLFCSLAKHWQQIEKRCKKSSSG